MSDNELDSGPRQCAALTRKKEPCRSWAIPGTEFCSVHSGRVGGAPRGNQNNYRHGWYAKSVKPITSIDEAVENLSEQLARSTSFLDQNLDDLETWTKVFALHAQALSRLGRLMRDQRALSGESADALLGLLAQAFEEINNEMDFAVKL